MILLGSSVHLTRYAGVPGLFELRQCYVTTEPNRNGRLSQFGRKQAQITGRQYSVVSSKEDFVIIDSIILIDAVFNLNRLNSSITIKTEEFKFK